MHHEYLGCKPVYQSTIRRVVGNCHVSDSHLSVIRHAILTLQKTKEKFFSMPKKHRRYMIAACIQHHKQNQNLYCYVMSGKNTEFIPRYYFDPATTDTIVAADFMPIIFSQENAA